eukprot:scaffold119087_cov60-Phaeocystis_antarctica.AAC.1
MPRRLARQRQRRLPPRTAGVARRRDPAAASSLCQLWQSFAATRGRATRRPTPPPWPSSRHPLAPPSHQHVHPGRSRSAAASGGGAAIPAWRGEITEARAGNGTQAGQQARARV